MTGKGSVFLFGPGFIGLEILRELLRSLDDSEIVPKASTAADIVIHSATADHAASAMAVLDGISERAKSNKSTIYIHTSACSEITDDSNGAYVSDKIYEDNEPEMIDSLPDNAPHRSIDLAILKRRKELGDRAKISIILPPVIYGVGKTSNRLSIQPPTMARLAIRHGYAGYVGEGKAVWGHIHVSDLARGYLTILHYMELTSSVEVLKNPYFFAENGEEYSWSRCAEEIGKALYAAGKVEDPAAREIPRDLYRYIFGDWSIAVVGQNARNCANRLRALGWRPREKGSFQSLREDELPIMLEEKTEFNGYAAPVAS